MLGPLLLSEPDNAGRPLAALILKPTNSAEAWPQVNAVSTDKVIMLLKDFIEVARPDLLSMIIAAITRT